MSIIKQQAQEIRDKIPSLRSKTSKLYGAETQPYNPFLDKDGNVFNKYLDYRAILNNPAVSAKTKEFIANATGLAPTNTGNTEGATASVNPSTSPVFVPASTQKGASVVPSSNSDIVNAATKYMGTPYVWGGESMDEGGMDCSGFVYNALKDAGYNVGRTTAQGYRQYGTSVSKKEMQPGDLIFYGKDNNNAGHIGIYIGNGQMIHSSGGSKNTKDNPGKGVSIANVDYRSDFLEARRY